MNIGSALKKIRFEKRLSQGYVVKKAKVSQTYLSLLENGKKPNPSQAVLKRILGVYDVPPIVLAWYAMEEKDVRPKKRELYVRLKASIDGLVSEIIKK